MQLGISSYTFGWAVEAGLMDARALLKFARAAGVSVVQVCDNLPLDALPEPHLQDVLAQARDSGISLEIGARGLTDQHLAEQINLAERVGASLLRFVIDGPQYQPSADEATRVLRNALGHLRHTSVVVAIENHDRFPARVLRRMVDELNHSQVGICLDTANSLGAGEGIEHVLTYLTPCTVNLHVKDFHIKRVPYLQGFTVEGRAAGQGMLDVPDVIARVSESKKCATAILELWTPPESSVAETIAKEARWARESLAYLRPLFAK